MQQPGRHVAASAASSEVAGQGDKVKVHYTGSASLNTLHHGNVRGCLQQQQPALRCPRIQLH